MEVSQLQPGEADKSRVEAWRGRAELDNAGSEVSNLRGATVALRRNLETAQQAWDPAFSTAVERDSEAFKVKGQLA